MESCLPAINHENIQEEIETFEATQMSMLCLKCGNYISLAHLQDHRALHDALSLFEYNMQTKPTNEQALSRKRVALVKGLNKILNVSRSAYRKELVGIDLAYEIIKSEMYGRLVNKARPSMYSSDHIDVTMKSFKTKLSSGITLGVCQSANEKWKSIMEDTYSYEAEYANGGNSGFFAVYDGYSGQTAARKCAGQLHVLLKEKLTKLNASGEICEKGECQLSACFRQTYDEIDKVLLLGDGETSRNRWSGCSAATCVISSSHLHVANVGNVKGILVKGDGTIWMLTEDHTPLNKKEKHRIKSNGDVHKWSKTVWVNGVAVTTRGLGNHGDPIFKLNVINTPAFSCVPLGADDQIILFGSGGFWEVFDEEEVVVLIQDWVESKLNERVKKINAGESEKENSPCYSEGLIRINIESAVPDLQAKPSSLDQETRGETLLENSGPQVSDKENYEKHSTFDKKECNHSEDNTTGLACGDIQNSSSNLERKDCKNIHNEDVNTNHMLNGKSSEKLCHDTLTRHVPKWLFSCLLEDVTDQDNCLIAVEMSKHLVRVALNGGAKDNITVMVVLLNRK